MVMIFDTEGQSSNLRSDRWGEEIEFDTLPTSDKRAILDREFVRICVQKWSDDFGKKNTALSR